MVQASERPSFPNWPRRVGRRHQTMAWKMILKKISSFLRIKFAAEIQHCLLCGLGSWPFQVHNPPAYRTPRYGMDLFKFSHWKSEAQPDRLKETFGKSRYH